MTTTHPSGWSVQEDGTWLPAPTPPGFLGDGRDPSYAHGDHTHGLSTTTTGAPATGTHNAGEFTVTADGHIWTCITSGTPGTWIDVSSQTVAGPAYALNTADQTFTTAADLVGASVTFTVGSFPVYVHGWAALMANATAGQPSKFMITDESATEKARNLFFSEAISHGFSPNAWEYIATPGTYTRKIQCSHHTGSGTVTVFTLNAPGGAFIRVVK